MAYHSVDDVSALLRGLQQRGLDFESDKPIPLADVERYIAETEQVMEARIGHRYIVPVEDDVGVEVLRYIASRLTAATVWRVIQGPTVTGESAKANEWERQALSLLQQVVDGTVGLGDAEPTDSISVFASGINTMHDNDRIWELGKRQW